MRKRKDEGRGEEGRGKEGREEEGGRKWEGGEGGRRRKREKECRLS